MAVLWKDRKRICGLPITFTKYRLEGERLYVTKGLLRTVEDETLLYRVTDAGFAPMQMEVSAL